MICSTMGIVFEVKSDIIYKLYEVIDYRTGL